jgi:hypothetical protein
VAFWLVFGLRRVWKLAKSTKACDAVNLKVCTQRDLDYEARKVKAILNYQGAYACELQHATDLFHEREGDCFTKEIDPCLSWFPPCEIDLMASGHWAQPNPEYTGGRLTQVPSLRVSFPLFSVVSRVLRFGHSASILVHRTRWSWTGPSASVATTRNLLVKSRKTHL